MWYRGIRWHLAPRMISILYSVVAVYFALKYTSFFAIHPILMIVAFIVLMAQGIQIFHAQYAWPCVLPWKSKINLHWIIQTATGISVAFGFLCIYTVKVSNQKRHFTTWHGTVGGVTCVCVACSLLGGVSNLRKWSFTTIVRHSVVKKVHKYFGIFTFLLGLTSIGIGFFSTWAQNEMHSALRYTLISLLIPLGLYILYFTIMRGPGTLQAKQ